MDDILRLSMDNEYSWYTYVERSSNILYGRNTYILTDTDKYLDTQYVRRTDGWNDLTLAVL